MSEFGGERWRGQEGCFSPLVQASCWCPFFGERSHFNNKRNGNSIQNGFWLWTQYRGSLPYFLHQIHTTTFEKSSLHLFQLFTIDIDSQRCGIMKLVGEKKQPQKLNVALSCAYLVKVVLWGSTCWQGLCSPRLGPPVQQHPLGKIERNTHSTQVMARALMA